MRDLQEQLKEGGDDDLEIEVVDDRPARDQRDPVDLETVDDIEMTDDEIAALGSRAEKRIKQLTFKMNEERRQREQADRERGEAIVAAQRAIATSQSQAHEISRYQKALIERSQALSSGVLSEAKAKLAASMEDGDAMAIAEAQTELTKAVNAEEQVSQVSRRYDEGAAAREAQAKAQPDPAAQKIQEIGTRKPTTEASDWAGKNSWFGKDRPMTAFAYGVHEELVMNGMTPDTPEYYSAIDKAVRETFPQAFSGGRTGGADDTVVDISPSAPRRTPVAPTGRTNGRGPSSGKVRLTRTQVQTAKALGVPLREYAKQVLAMEAEANG